MPGKEALTFTSPYEVIEILDFTVNHRPNDHVRFWLKAIVSQKTAFEQIVRDVKPDEIKLEMTDGKQNYVLFHGVLEDIKIAFQADVHTMEFVAVSATALMDEKENSRSFQDKSMIYKAMHEKVLEPYSDFVYHSMLDDSKAIPAPLLQYLETDWTYFIRMASHLGGAVYADASENKIRLCLGLPKGKHYEIEKEATYAVERSVYDYLYEWADEADIAEFEFTRYTIDRQEVYNIGDTVRFRNIDLRVVEKESYFHQAIVWHRYVLSSENSLYRRKRYNPNLSGLSLSGNVIDRKGQAVKIHLNIDEEQPVETAYWFPYEPPTGTIMYCMPVLGTEVSISLNDRDEQPSFAYGCIRHNGRSDAQTNNPDIRYLHTEHGSYYKYTPDHSCLCAPDENIDLSIWEIDSSGISAKSDSAINMKAGGDIAFTSTEGNIIFHSAKGTLFYSKGSSALSVRETVDIVSTGNVVADLAGGDGTSPWGRFIPDSLDLSERDKHLMSSLAYMFDQLPEEITGRKLENRPLSEIAELVRDNPDAWPPYASGGFTIREFMMLLDEAANDPELGRLKLVSSVNHNPYGPDRGQQMNTTETSNSGLAATCWEDPATGERVFAVTGSEGNPWGPGDWPDNGGTFGLDSSKMNNEFVEFYEANKSSSGNHLMGHSAGGSPCLAVAAIDPTVKGTVFNPRGLPTGYMTPERYANFQNNPNFYSVNTIADLVSNTDSLGRVLVYPQHQIMVPGRPFYGYSMDDKNSYNYDTAYYDPYPSEKKVNTQLGLYKDIGNFVDMNYGDLQITTAFYGLMNYVGDAAKPGVILSGINTIKDSVENLTLPLLLTKLIPQFGNFLDLFKASHFLQSQFFDLNVDIAGDSNEGDLFYNPDKAAQLSITLQKYGIIRGLDD